MHEPRLGERQGLFGSKISASWEISQTPSKPGPLLLSLTGTDDANAKPLLARLTGVPPHDRTAVT